MSLWVLAITWTAAVTPQATPTVPSMPPDSIPRALVADSNLVQSIESSTRWPRNVLTVLFKRGTTQAGKETAIALVNGVVVGGQPLNDDGFYLVRVPDDGTDGPLRQAIDIIRQLPQVRAATRLFIVKVIPNSLRSNDDSGGTTVGTSLQQTVPLTPPDSIPRALIANSNLVQSPGWSTRWPRNVLMVMFQQGTSQADKEAAVRLVNGVVVGGQRLTDDGYYLVRVPDDGTDGPLMQAIETIRELPQVRSATRFFLLEFIPASLRSNDDSGGITVGTSLPVVGRTQADTSRPVIPDSLGLPNDTSFVVPSPFGTGELYYRDIISVIFDDSTSGVTIRSIFARYHATIIGGIRGNFISAYNIRVPDPGPTHSAIDSVARAITMEPGVASASVAMARTRIRLRTSRPAIPEGTGMPSGPVLTVAFPADTLEKVLRNVVEVVFDDSTSGVTIRGLLDRYDASIIGGDPHIGSYILQIPDPGPTWEALDSVLTALENEPGVDVAWGMDWLGRIELPSRYPKSGLGVDPTPPDTGRPGQTVPSTPPDSIPRALIADSNLVKSTESSTRWARNVLAVLFREGTSQVDKETAIGLVNGVVVGGQPVHDGGFYLVRVPDDGTDGPLMQAMEAVRQLPQVVYVKRLFRLKIVPNSLGADDESEWTTVGTWPRRVSSAPVCRPPARRTSQAPALSGLRCR